LNAPGEERERGARYFTLENPPECGLEALDVRKHDRVVDELRLIIPVEKDEWSALKEKTGRKLRVTVQIAIQEISFHLPRTSIVDRGQREGA
jgi:hypothetical protein